MDQISSRQAAGPEGSSGKHATGKAGGAAPGAPGTAAGLQKNSFTLKYKKSTKISLETFSPSPTKHKNKRKKGGGGERVWGSPPLQRNPWHTDGAGEELGGWGTVLSGYITIMGQGVGGRRQKAPQGWGKDAAHISPRVQAQAAPPHPSSVQIKALSTTQGSYADRSMQSGLS